MFEMPDPESSRKSMVGIPPMSKKPRGSGGSTPASVTTASSTPTRTSSRSVKRPKREFMDEEGDEQIIEEESNAEKESDEEQDDSPDEGRTPTRKRGKKKRVPLTDYHLKKKKILARKAQREAEREKEKEKPSEESEIPIKIPTPEPVRKAPSFSDYTPLQLMMDHIIRQIVAKDPEEYFMFPVTRSMAPDYHEIIKIPMDFQTIREKIDDNKYDSIGELRKDFELIVVNAMQYNQSNTVFYLAANRLSMLIKYFFSEQYLRYLFHTLPFANEIPLEKAGLTPLAPLIKNKYVNNRKSALVDDMTADQCLEISETKIKQKLTTRKPTAKLAFLEEKNGTVVLNVLSENGRPSEKKVTLLDIIGPLEEGTPGMIQLGEHRLYSQAPINYLNYGPFSSFAPQYDSTWATMTKEDTDLYLRTYGDREIAGNVMSLRKFVAGSDDLAASVDCLLDSLTDGEHSKTLKATGEMPSDEEVLKNTENEEIEMDVENEDTMDLISSVSTLQNLGLDVGFLNEFQQSIYSNEASNDTNENIYGQNIDIQQTLNTIGQGIQDLAHLQQARLSQPPPPALINIQDAGPIEQKLAENIQEQLVHQIANHTSPENFVSAPALHEAMGIDMDGDDLFSEFFVTG